MARKIKDESGREIVFSNGAYHYKTDIGRDWNTCTVHYQHEEEQRKSQEDKYVYFSGEVDVKMLFPLDKEYVERIARAVIKSRTPKPVVDTMVQCW